MDSDLTITHAGRKGQNVFGPVILSDNAQLHQGDVYIGDYELKVDFQRFRDSLFFPELNSREESIKYARVKGPLNGCLNVGGIHDQLRSHLSIITTLWAFMIKANHIIPDPRPCTLKTGLNTPLLSRQLKRKRKRKKSTHSQLEMIK